MIHISQKIPQLSLSVALDDLSKENKRKKNDPIVQISHLLEGVETGQSLRANKPWDIVSDLTKHKKVGVMGVAALALAILVPFAFMGKPFVPNLDQAKQKFDNQTQCSLDGQFDLPQNEPIPVQFDFKSAEAYYGNFLKVEAGKKQSATFYMRDNRLIDEALNGHDLDEKRTYLRNELGNQQEDFEPLADETVELRQMPKSTYLATPSFFKVDTIHFDPPVKVSTILDFRLAAKYFPLAVQLRQLPKSTYLANPSFFKMDTIHFATHVDVSTILDFRLAAKYFPLAVQLRQMPKSTYLATPSFFKVDTIHFDPTVKVSTILDFRLASGVAVEKNKVATPVKVNNSYIDALIKQSSLNPYRFEYNKQITPSNYIASLKPRVNNAVVSKTKIEAAKDNPPVENQTASKTDKESVTNSSNSFGDCSSGLNADTVAPDKAFAKDIDAILFPETTAVNNSLTRAASYQKKPVAERPLNNSSAN